MGTTKAQRLDPAAAAALVRSRDTITTGFVSGQAVGLLEALGARDDLEDVTLVNGILVPPYAFLQKRTVQRRERVLRTDRADGARDGGVASSSSPSTSTGSSASRCA